jgi:hypothetical protein
MVLSKARFNFTFTYMSLPIEIYMFLYIIPHCLNPFVTTIKTVFYTFAFHRPCLPEDITNMIYVWPLPATNTTMTAI